MKTYRLKKISNAVLLALGIAIIFTFVLFAIAPSAFAPCDPKFSYEAFLSPSGEHILGTDNLGYDIFSEIVYATRNTLAEGVLAAVLAMAFGTVFGLIAGYAKGVAGEALNGIVNFFILIPTLPLAIVVGAYLNGGVLQITLLVAALAWSGTARAVRAKVADVKNSPYIKLLRGMGLSRTRVLFKHILPNVADVAAAKFITTVSSCILLEATLGFLGAGTSPAATWGVMISNAYKFGGLARGAYNWLLVPGVCITLLELAFYFINTFFERRASLVRGGGSILE